MRRDARGESDHSRFLSSEGIEIAKREPLRPMACSGLMFYKTRLRDWACSQLCESRIYRDPSFSRFVRTLVMGSARGLKKGKFAIRAAPRWVNRESSFLGFKDPDTNEHSRCLLVGRIDCVSSPATSAAADFTILPFGHFDPVIGRIHLERSKGSACNSAINQMNKVVWQN